MTDINKIAHQVRLAFITGKPCTMPLMTMRDWGRLLDLLGDEQLEEV